MRTHKHTHTHAHAHTHTHTHTHTRTHTRPAVILICLKPLLPMIWTCFRCALVATRPNFTCTDCWWSISWPLFNQERVSCCSPVQVLHASLPGRDKAECAECLRVFLFAGSYWFGVNWLGCNLDCWQYAPVSNMHFLNCSVSEIRQLSLFNMFISIKIQDGTQNTASDNQQNSARWCFPQLARSAFRQSTSHGNAGERKCGCHHDNAPRRHCPALGLLQGRWACLSW